MVQKTTYLLSKYVFFIGFSVGFLNALYLAGACCRRVYYEANSDVAGMLVLLSIEFVWVQFE